MEKHILNYSGAQVDHLLAKIEQAPDAIASEAYVQTEVANLVNSAPETLDTLGEVAKAIQDNETVVDALNSAIGNKADKSEIPDMSRYATQDYVQQAILAGTPVLTTIVPTAIEEADGWLGKNISFSWPADAHSDGASSSDPHDTVRFSGSSLSVTGLGTVSFSSDATNPTYNHLLPCSKYGGWCLYYAAGATYLNITLSKRMAITLKYRWYWPNSSYGSIRTYLYGRNSTSDAWVEVDTRYSESLGSLSSSKAFKYYRLACAEQTSRTALSNLSITSAKEVGSLIKYSIPVVANYFAGLTISVQVSSTGGLSSYYYPHIQINNLADVPVNGTLNTNTKYTLVYNGTSFDIQN